MNPANPHARLWLFDFDNTLAALEREVDWPGSRRELEAFLRGVGIDERIFAEIPKGNLPLYAALHTRWLRTPGTEAKIPSIATATVQNHLRWPSHETGLPQLETAEGLLRSSSEIIERHELIGVERAQPTAGAIDLLEALIARGSIVVIVTSNSSRTVARWLALHRISELVGAIVGRDSLLALKPSPEMVLRALEIGETQIGEAVFVGDSEADFGAARAAGLGFFGIAVTDAARTRLSVAGASKVFVSPATMRVHLNL